MKKICSLLSLFALFAITSCGGQTPVVPGPTDPDPDTPVTPDKPVEPDNPEDKIVVTETDKDGFNKIIGIQLKQIKDTLTEENARPYKMDYSYKVESNKSMVLADDTTLALKEHNIVRTDAIINHNLRKKQIHVNTAGLTGSTNYYYKIAQPDEKMGTKETIKLNGDFKESLADNVVSSMKKEDINHETVTYEFDKPLVKESKKDAMFNYCITDVFDVTTLVNEHMLSSVETLANNSFKMFEYLAPVAEGWTPKYVITTNENDLTVKFENTWVFEQTVDGVPTKGETKMSILMYGTAIKSLIYSTRTLAKIDDNNFGNSQIEISFNTSDYQEENLEFDITGATKTDKYNETLPSATMEFPFI